MFIQEINLDGYKSIGINWIALYVNDVNVTCFDSFGVEYIVKEIKKVHRTQKHSKKCLLNTSLLFNNVWTLLHWIY